MKKIFLFVTVFLFLGAANNVFALPLTWSESSDGDLGEALDIGVLGIG